MTKIRRHIFWLVRIIWDFVKGMCVLRAVGPCVTVFGSARLTPEADVYHVARKLGAVLAELGVTVMTGGGPGLMEAVSRGVREAGGRTAACRMRLPYKQRPNRYLDYCVTYRYFFVRKVMMLRQSCAFVVLPGGLGTFDELFELLTLIQTKKIPPVPIVFLGTAYWQPLLNLINGMVSCGTITSDEMELIMRLVLVTDDVQTASAHLAVYSLGPAQRRENRPPEPDPPRGCGWAGIRQIRKGEDDERFGTATL